MRKIKEVLRLKLDAKLSHGQIAAALHLSKGVVTKYVGLAAAAGLDWSAIQLLDDVTLERRLLAGPEKPRLPYTATGVLKTTGPAQAKFPAPCQSSGDAIPVMEAMHPVGERHWHLGRERATQTHCTRHKTSHTYRTSSETHAAFLMRSRASVASPPATQAPARLRNSLDTRRL